MDVGALIAGLGGLVDIGTSIANSVGARQQAERNYQAEKEQLAWQKFAQQETWKREDTAVQRRTADLRAAGINPILAAGQAAGVSSPISVTAPKKEYVPVPSVMDKAQAALALMRQQVDISQTQAQTALTRLQQLNAAVALRKGLAETEAVRLSNDRFAYDTSLFKRVGLPSNTAGVTRDVANALHLFQQDSPAKQQAKVLINKIIDKLNQPVFQNNSAKSMKIFPDLPKFK